MGISCKDKIQLCQHVGVNCSSVSVRTYTMFISMEFNTMGISCKDKVQLCQCVSMICSRVSLWM